MIVMNPPFSADEKHILHAYDIAPNGCTIISLCNLSTIHKDRHTFYDERRFTEEQRRLKSLIEFYGEYEDLGQCFDEAERKTGVAVGLIRIKKPGASYEKEFEGFFMDDDPQENQENALMPYNVIRDLVQRYTEAVKIYDKQLEEAERMNDLTAGFFASELAMTITQEDKPKSRNDFKKDLQKSGWNFIFDKMNMKKYATRGLKEDINKFVETQQNIPFTMRNIYRMLEIIVGTQAQRMDKALLEVFDRLTQHYHENRFNVEGWKTNSHYLIQEKFIMPYVTRVGFSGQMETNYGDRGELIEDMQKALCYITGTNYDQCTSLYDFMQKNKCEFGKWYSWGFFEIRGYKKGTMHFKFNSYALWADFNQRIAKLKGYPLYERAAA